MKKVVRYSIIPLALVSGSAFAAIDLTDISAAIADAETATVTAGTAIAVAAFALLGLRWLKGMAFG